MASVINAAIDSVQLAADSKSIHLEVTLDPSARHVSGDASRLQQVVWNLLSNAIKFTPSGGASSVRLEHVASVYRSASPIRDPASLRSFFRLSLTASARRMAPARAGTGGLVWDWRLFGIWSSFTAARFTPTARERDSARHSQSGFLLPHRTSARQSRTKSGNLMGDEADTRRSVLFANLDGIRVLLVDDDQDNLQILTVMLTERRATVQAASSVAEALAMLEWYEPDVLVSDLAMPDEDGFSLISKMRELEGASGKQIPAVALTAYVRVEDRARALTAGFNLFVPKPVEPNELVAAIAHLAEPGSAFGRGDIASQQ